MSIFGQRHFYTPDAEAVVVIPHHTVRTVACTPDAEAVVVIPHHTVRTVACTPDGEAVVVIPHHTVRTVACTSVRQDIWNACKCLIYRGKMILNPEHV